MVASPTTKTLLTSSDELEHQDHAVKNSEPALKKQKMPSKLDDVDLTVKIVPTTPYTDQKPGTSGVRKKTKVFMQENYIENFVQATLDAVPSDTPKTTLLIATDGRYYSDIAIQKVLQVALGNGVKEVLVGLNGFCSTPAVSAVIRTSKTPIFGAFILTASHNPGGIDEDFGIKYNGATGGPDEGVYQVMYKNSLNIKEYKSIANLGAVLGSTAPSPWFAADMDYTFADRSVKVIDTAKIHCDLLKEVFDFPLMKRLIAHPKFSAKFDCMCGVQGPYAKKILIDELGMKSESILRGTPLPDFGGHDAPHHGHADPNLTHAHDLVNKMGLDTEGKKLPNTNPADFPFFGAAWDGDADRNMILGRQFFVIPSDSLAFIVDQADECIPYFKKQGKLKSAARSMPTSRACDTVCAKKGIQMFETPTGWKFFGNLMESGDCPAFKGKPLHKPLICGEEAFGTASCHAREKDGMWAVLCYLQILAVKNESKLDTADATLIGVEDIAIAHWLTYGRHFYARYDWEGIDKEKAESFFKALEQRIPGLKGQSMGAPFDVKIENADSFNYTDPVDGSSATNQGLRIFFSDGSRIVFRLSGTGVVGATIRVYLEKYLKSTKVEDLVKNHLDEVEPLGAAMIKFTKIADFTGLPEPTLRT